MQGPHQLVLFSLGYISLLIFITPIAFSLYSASFSLHFGHLRWAVFCPVDALSYLSTRFHSINHRIHLKSYWTTLNAYHRGIVSSPTCLTMLCNACIVQMSIALSITTTNNNNSHHQSAYEIPNTVSPSSHMASTVMFHHLYHRSPHPA